MEATEATATAKYVRMGPRKVRFVLDTIRGKYATDALDQLKFTSNHAADEIANVIKSAMANAVNNHDMEGEYLKVVRCFVDPGPTAKRVQPRAQGRAYRILKRSSHITVVVAEGEAPPTTNTREVEIKRKGKKPPLRAALPGQPVADTATVAAALVNTDETPQPALTVEERDETASAPATDTVATVETGPAETTDAPIAEDVAADANDAPVTTEAATGTGEGVRNDDVSGATISSQKTAE